ILKSKSHSDCEKTIIDSIFSTTIDEILKTGSPKRLGGDPNKSPFIRKRISISGSGKSAGFRLYLWIIFADENIYLLFIHPKTGRKSGTNLTIDKQKELVKTFIDLRKKNGFHLAKLNEDFSKIISAKTRKHFF
ncbi:MAG: hypothetical protein ABR595_09990, partial [Psychroflexus sp.]